MSQNSETKLQTNNEDSFLIKPQFYDLGWGFLVAWGISIIFSGVFSLDGKSNLGYFWICSMIGAPCGLLFLFLCRCDFQKKATVDRFQFFALSMMTLGTGLLVVSLFTDEGLSAVLQVIGGLISSLGTAIFTVFWGVRFTALNMQQIESYAVYSLLLAFGCYALVLFTPQVFGIALVLLLPFLTLYCLRKGSAVDGHNPQKDFSKITLPFAYKKFVRLGLGIVASTTVISLFWSLTDSNTLIISKGLFEASLLSGIVVAILLAAYLSWFSRYLNLNALYRWVCPLVIISFSLASLLKPGITLIACLLIFAAQAMLNLITFVYFAELSKRTGVSPVKIFGLGRFFQEVGFLIGILLSVMLAYPIEEGLIGLSSILLFASAFLVFFVIVATSDQERPAFALSEAASSEPETTNTASIDELLSLAGEEISKKHNLTNREKEILGYLVKGYSLPYIRSELHISQSTIDTHARHIYSKLGIHSRKELINLVHTEDR